MKYDTTNPNTKPEADRQAHPAPRLIVDLSAIRANYAKLSDMAPASEIGAVVKANAYGLGALNVLPALAEAGCRTFYVAHTSEGEEARRALSGHSADIFVFNGFWPAELDTLRSSSLFPVVNTLSQLEQLRVMAPDLPCAIHIDTGMSRLGLDADETGELIANPRLIDAVDVRQIMSHLACADETGHPLNAKQLRRFDRVRQAFPNIPASLANSAGVLLGKAYQCDVCRPGLALFGGNPVPGAVNPFEPAVSIESPILQIRQLNPGDTVGYGATFTASRPMTVATVASGYADGVLRACGDGGHAWLGERKLPILGRISMDLICVDLSELDPSPAPGASVRFLGADIDSLAAAAHTLNYELLVRLGMRFHREYTDNPA